MIASIHVSYFSFFTFCLHLTPTFLLLSKKSKKIKRRQIANLNGIQPTSDPYQPAQSTHSEERENFPFPAAEYSRCAAREQQELGTFQNAAFWKSKKNRWGKSKRRLGNGSSSSGLV